MDTNIGALTSHAGVQNSTAGLLPSRANGPSAPLPSTPAASDPALAGALSKAEPTSQQPSQQELQQAVDQANTSLAKRSSNELRFAIEAGAGISVIKLVDLKTGEDIVQFPSKIMLEIAKTIDQVTGAIIKHKV
jgi:uncharacterized FlaG/YvyC family protein